MSDILVGSDLVEKPYDKFWDSPPTRRELQRAFTKLGNNDAELMSMFDTAFIVTNYLCEKLGVTKKDLDDYVEQKKSEMAAIKASQVTQESNDLRGKEGVQ